MVEGVQSPRESRTSARGSFGVGNVPRRVGLSAAHAFGLGTRREAGSALDGDSVHAIDVSSKAKSGLGSVAPTKPTDFLLSPTVGVNAAPGLESEDALIPFTPPLESDSNPKSVHLKGWRTPVSVVAAGAVIAGLTTIGPFKSSAEASLPVNDCYSSLSAFNTDHPANNPQTAQACVLRKKAGREILVDEAGLSPAVEEEILKLVRHDITTITAGEVAPEVSEVDATPKAYGLYRSSLQPFLHNGCLTADLPAQDSAAAIARATMPVVRKAAYVVALTPDKICPSPDGNTEYGISDSNTIYADVHIGATGKDPGLVATTITHEGKGGHLDEDNHTGFITIYTGNVDTNYKPFYGSGTSITLPKEDFAKGSYFEYDHTSVMGMGDFGPNNRVPIDTPMQLDQLNWEKSLLDPNDGQSDLRVRMLNGNGSVPLTQQEATQGHYIMAKLKKSISVDNGKDTFTRIAFLPKLNPSTGAISELRIWFLDDVYRNAYLGTDSLKDLPFGMQKLNIAGNEFSIHLTPSGGINIAS